MPEYQIENLYSGTKVDTGSLRAHIYYFCESPRLCNRYKAHGFKKWRLTGGNGVTMYTVAYRVLTVPIPWFPAGHQVRTDPLRNETERLHITLNGTNFA